MPLFGRDSEHRYDAALREWLAHKSCDRRAMARNLISDHRVTAARAEIFGNFVATECTCSALSSALIQYKTQRVRRPDIPDFANEEINGSNVLCGGSSGAHNIPKDASLAQLINLNGLEPVYRWAKRKGMPGFERFTRPGTSGLEQFLLEEVAEPAGFVDRVLTTLNAYSGEIKHHPSWVTYWEDLEPHLAGSADRWAHLLGLDFEAGDFVIVLRYPVRRAGTVARPTQLDAGWDANHFPSPPCSVIGTGGHPLDLHDTDNVRVMLLPEFVHQQVDYFVSDWIAAGSRIERTRGEGLCSLELARERHHRLLVSVYGVTVEEWMPNSH
jgi:hypothetical protein